MCMENDASIRGRPDTNPSAGGALHCSEKAGMKVGEM